MAKVKTSPDSDAAVTPADFFVLRTPLLPFATLTAWAAGLRAVTADREGLAGALADDRRLLRDRLRELVRRPEVREALFLASPSLDDSLDAWQTRPDSEAGQKVERTLVRYLARMAGRPTPFGLFAGCSVGRVGAATDLRIEGLARYGRHTRLDGDYLSALTEAIGGDPAWRGAALYRPNSSLYRAAGRLRHVVARSDGAARSYHLVAVEPSEYLEATLARAADGASLAALAEALVDGDVTREDADEFVGELVDAQLLVSDLQPQVTGAEPIHDLIDQLTRQAATREVGSRLEHTRDALSRLDAASPGTAPATYREIAVGLAGLPVAAELSRLFQVDMVKPAPAATIGPEVVRAIASSVEILRKLATRPRETGLTRFRDAFSRRYEGREVPLLEVLDEESGVGFESSNAPSAEASPLLQGLAFGAGGRDGEEQVAWGVRGALLLRKLEEALRTGAREVALSSADVDAMASKQPPALAGSIAAMATLAAASPGAFVRGEFLVWVHSITGPSGANLLGRFCHGDPELTARVVQHLRDEETQRPGVVFAEVVHLPEGRVGNVLLRPQLREHEIPYLGRSGAPPDRQIRVDDLLVSLRDGRVVLRSRRSGVVVIPRLTTAHNFASPRNLAVYRFLCALQHEEMGGLGFSWGPLESSGFLPRVRVGKLVLSLARWRLGGATLRELGECDEAERFARVQALRRERGLPRWVAVTDGDNVLPVDLDNLLSIETFAQLVRRRPMVVLTEVFEPEQMCAEGPEGMFVHELVVPMIAPRPPAPAPRPARPPARAEVVRQYAPGSEWLYAKLYTGAATADGLLRDLVAPVVRAALASGAASEWFFIRYGDPEWHLRVRLRGDPGRLLGEVLPMLANAAQDGVADGRLWRFQVDTYDREVERYGGAAGIVLAEALFHADSDACLGIVETLAGDAGADARWRLALRGMDLLLDDLGFGLAHKRAIVHECRQRFGAEFHAEGPLRHQLGDKFRRERVALEALLDPAHDANSELAPGLELLRGRSLRLGPIAAALQASERDGRLRLPVAVLAASFLHMHANRLLRAAARAQELVLYDLLDRLYEGRMARAKRRGA